MSKTIVIYSGGMDSYTLLIAALADGPVMALSFDYGQRHKRELEATRKVTGHLGVEHHIIPIPGIMQGSALTGGEIEVPEGHYADDNMKLTVVPNRNMIMLAIAIGVAESKKYDRVWFGAHAGDHAIYPDCRPTFVAALNEAAAYGTYSGVKVEAPFIHLDKGQILDLGINRLGIFPESYADTWTCYKGGEKACGKCGSCTERLEAFASIGVKDPLEYEDA